MDILTAYQRPSQLRNYLASTHANTCTVKYGGPASQPRKSQAARNRGAVSALGRATVKQCYQAIFSLQACTTYAYIGRDTHAIFQAFVYTLPYFSSST